MEQAPRRARREFSPEFKARTVELIESSGKSIGQVCRELDLTETAVRRWVKLARIDAGTVPGLDSEERAELARLRRENKVLREEREILKKPRPSSLRRRGEADPTRRPHSDIRLHRGLVQPAPTPLRARLPQPGRVRASPPLTTGAGGLRKLSVKAGQSHLVIEWTWVHVRMGWAGRPRAAARARRPSAARLAERLTAQANWIARMKTAGGATPPAGA